MRCLERLPQALDHRYYSTLSSQTCRFSFPSTQKTIPQAAPSVAPLFHTGTTSSIKINITNPKASPASALKLFKTQQQQQHRTHNRSFSTTSSAKMPLPLKSYLTSQLFTTLPIPTQKFTSQTVIVTGSNTGIGLEAARYFVALGAGKVILAVRDIAKGQSALQSIRESTHCADDVLEVWELDLLRYDSVLGFAERAKEELERIDVLVANAGVYFTRFGAVELPSNATAGHGEIRDEATIVVNVISHMLLAILLLPKLRTTAAQTGKKGVITFTGSFTHHMTKLEEPKAPGGGGIFEELADEKKARMGERYYVSKLMQLLIMREFAHQLSLSESSSENPSGGGTGKKGRIITSAVNPGFVATDILRNRGYLSQLAVVVLRKAMARTAEEGARTVVHGAMGGEETHGEYLDDCRVGTVSSFVTSEDGQRVQKQLWKELAEKLEKIHPGIMGHI